MNGRLITLIGISVIGCNMSAKNWLGHNKASAPFMQAFSISPIQYSGNLYVGNWLILFVSNAGVCKWTTIGISCNSGFNVNLF